jgi:hypothetical protein
MTHRYHRDCAHDCDECHLAEPDLCPDFAQMTADDHSVRWCKYCEVKAWHADLVIKDGEGSEQHRRYFECPRCHHMWVDPATPYNGTYWGVGFPD